MLKRVPGLERCITSATTHYDLKFLKETISRLTDDQAELFSGALQIEKASNLDGALRVLDQLYMYTLFPGTSTLGKLGKKLVEQGYCETSGAAGNNLIYSRLAEDFCSAHGKALTAIGYVLKTGFGKLSGKGYSARVELVSPNTGTVHKLRLPASEADFKDALVALAVEEFHQCDIRSVSATAECSETIGMAGLTSGEIDVLNILLKNMETIVSQGKYKTFLATAEAMKPECMTDLAIITDEIDDYYLYPENVRSPAEYSKHLRGMDPSDPRDGIIHQLYGWIMFERDGLNSMRTLGTMKTSHGLLDYKLPAWFNR